MLPLPRDPPRRSCIKLGYSQEHGAIINDRYLRNLGSVERQCLIPVSSVMNLMKLSRCYVSSARHDKQNSVIDSRLHVLLFVAPEQLLIRLWSKTLKYSQMNMLPKADKVPEQNDKRKLPWKVSRTSASCFFFYFFPKICIS